MRKRLRMVYKAAYPYRVFFCFAAFALCFFIYFVLTRGYVFDDEAYHTQARTLRLPEFWALHTRLVIDTVQYFLMRLPLIVWQLCNAAVYGLLAFLICNLLRGLRSRACSVAEQVLVCAGVFCIGTIDNSIGVISIQCSHTWALCAGLLALLPLQRAYFGPAACAWAKPVPVLALLALPYAANQQLTAAVLCGFLLAGAVVLARRRDRSALYCALQLLLCLACAGWLLYHSLRRLALFGEQDMYFPGFSALRFPQKLEYGLSSTAYLLLYNRYSWTGILLLLFNAWLLYCTFIHVRKWLPRCAAAIPLGVSLPFCAIWSRPHPSGYGTLLRGSPFLMDRVFGYAYQPEPWLDLALLLSFACICAGVCACLGRTRRALSRRALPCLLILLAGFGTRLLMGMSPCAYASGGYNYQYFFAALLVCAFMIAPKKKKRKGAFA